MDFNLIAQAAVNTVGITQVIKNFMPKKTPTFVYTIIMLFLAIVFTWVNSYHLVVANAITVIAVAQTGYETIIQTIKKLANISASKVDGIITKTGKNE